MENTDKPEVTDAETEIDESIENIFEEAGDTDVEGKSEAETVGSLSLDDINTVLKRDFKTKEEALKSLDGLKNLVGDQELAKERKAKKEEPKGDKLSEMEQKLARLEKESITKDFLLATPTAKEHLDLVEAYAEKHGLSLSEAWESKVSKLAESSQSRTVINKNRITPVQSQRVSDLAERAKTGDQNATDELINTLVWKK